MKKINNLILVCGLIFLGFSCEDATDIFPEGNLTSDVTFETLEDLQLGLNGAYARYSPEDDILINSVLQTIVNQGMTTVVRKLIFITGHLLLVMEIQLASGIVIID